MAEEVIVFWGFLLFIVCRVASAVFADAIDDHIVRRQAAADLRTLENEMVTEEAQRDLPAHRPRDPHCASSTVIPFRRRGVA